MARLSSLLVFLFVAVFVIVVHAVAPKSTSSSLDLPALPPPTQPAPSITATRAEAQAALSKLQAINPDKIPTALQEEIIVVSRILLSKNSTPTKQLLEEMMADVDALVEKKDTAGMEKLFKSEWQKISVAKIEDVDETMWGGLMDMVDALVKETTSSSSSSDVTTSSTNENGTSITTRNTTTTSVNTTGKGDKDKNAASSVVVSSNVMSVLAAILAGSTILFN